MSGGEYTATKSTSNKLYVLILLQGIMEYELKKIILSWCYACDWIKW